MPGQNGGHVGFLHAAFGFTNSKARRGHEGRDGGVGGVFSRLTNSPHVFLPIHYFADCVVKVFQPAKCAGDKLLASILISAKSVNGSAPINFPL